MRKQSSHNIQYAECEEHCSVFIMDLSRRARWPIWWSWIQMKWMLHKTLFAQLLEQSLVSLWKVIAFTGWQYVSVKFLEKCIVWGMHRQKGWEHTCQQRKGRPMVTVPKWWAASGNHAQVLSLCVRWSRKCTRIRESCNNAKFLQTNVPVLGTAKNPCTSQHTKVAETKAEVWPVHRSWNW